MRNSSKCGESSEDPQIISQLRNQSRHRNNKTGHKNEDNCAKPMRKNYSIPVDQNKVTSNDLEDSSYERDDAYGQTDEERP